MKHIIEIENKIVQKLFLEFDVCEAFLSCFKTFLNNFIKKNCAVDPRMQSCNPHHYSDFFIFFFHMPISHQRWT